MTAAMSERTDTAAVGNAKPDSTRLPRSSSPFQLGELGTFFSAFPTGLAATGKRVNLGMLFASFGKLLTSARTDIAEWICIL